jgi:hypothetical protein
LEPPLVYMCGDRKMKEAMQSARHGASKIKTLRIGLGPGASTINQLAAAVSRRRAQSAALISVAGFFFPYLPGFPVLAFPGRKALAPVYTRLGR